MGKLKIFPFLWMYPHTLLVNKTVVCDLEPN